MKLLLGGSPCQFWCAGKAGGRETAPSGAGWELFRNYVIAGQRYRPDFFLYENNKSMSNAIRERITEELGVEPILINSALVSAQNRQRLYWTDIPGVGQPEDREIFLSDILERDKSGTPTIGFAVRRLGRWTIGGKRVADSSRDMKTVQRYEVSATPEKASCLTSIQKHNLVAVPLRSGETDGDNRKRTFEIRGGVIQDNGRRYPVRLADGFYLIRNLTLRECARLQTVPESYRFPVSDSQARKLLSNGWTVAVIAHILSHCPGIRTEPLEVLSMYDGMSCGRLALNNLGANVVRYYATEIDRYAIATTQANFPDAVQLGDAFQVRNPGWNPRNAA